MQSPGFLLTFQRVSERPRGQVLVHKAQVAEILAEPDEVHEVAVVQTRQHLHLPQKLLLAMAGLHGQALDRNLQAVIQNCPAGGGGGR